MVCRRKTKGSIRRCGLGVAMGLLCSAAVAQALEFHVSPEGDDANPGTGARPFRTLHRARDEVRTVNGDMQADTVVLLHAGEYALDAPFVLTEEDSGRNGHAVVYRSRDGIGQARITGGRPVTGWTETEPGIWRAEVGKDHVFHTLYDNGRRVRKARHPNYVHQERFPTAAAPYLVAEDGSLKQEPGERRSWVKYAEGDLDPAALAVGTLKINVWPWGKCDWHRWICEVVEIDPEKRLLAFDNLGDQTEIKPLARYFIEDHRALLDAPGEFYLDRDKGLLYYIPLDGGDPNRNRIVRPVLHSLIRLEGAAPDQPVRNVVFDGLRFEETDGFSPTLHPWTHGWGQRDHALVYCRNTEGIAILRCHLRNSGRNGILLPGANRNNRIESCLIERIGANGITLSCPGIPRDAAGEPVPNERNVVTNTRIHDVGELSIYAECIGVFNSSRNEITHCDLFRSPRYAITMRGNTVYDETKQEFNPGALPATDNRFAYLRVYDCGQDSGDMGALHAACVNIPDGPYRNTFEQITVENIHAVAGMNDWAPDGIFLDWPKLTMNQIFRQVQIEDVAGMQLRSNRPDNAASASVENVSWEPGFDPSRMDYNRIGVRPDFPAEFGGPGERHAVPEPPRNLRGQARDAATVTLVWDAPVNAGHFPRLLYEVFRDGERVGGTEDHQFVDRELAESTRYTYQVRAGNGRVGPRDTLGAELAVTTPADTVPPVVRSVQTNQSRTAVMVEFSKPVEKETAENVTHYAFAPAVELARAESLDRNPRIVLLSLSEPLPEDEALTLAVHGVRDRAAGANPMTGIQRVPVRATSLLLHYSLNEERGDRVSDSSGNGRDGQLEGEGVWLPMEGKTGGALLFDGRRVWIRGPEDLALGTGDFTLAVWLWKAAPGASIILAQANGFGSPHEWSWGWEWPTKAGNIAFRSNAQFWTTAPDSIALRQWQHIAFVRRGNQGFSYVDGEPSGGPHDLAELGDLTSGKPLRVGRREHEPNPAFFNGRLDDLRIYSRALDQNEIRNLMAEKD